MHTRLGAVMTSFAGWQMPLRYGSEIAEHQAVRHAAGLFDLSHMGEIAVTGPGAGPALDYAVCGWPSRLSVGRARYTMLCAPDGGIIDDAGHCPAYLQLLVKAAQMPGLRELAENAVPAHLVICGKDRVLPSPRFSRHFRTHLPDESHRVTELDGVGHVPMYEAPGRITEVITDFLDQCIEADSGRHESTG